MAAPMWPGQVRACSIESANRSEVVAALQRLNCDTLQIRCSTGHPLASRRYRGHPLNEPQRALLRDPGKSRSEASAAAGRLRWNSAPLSTCFTAAATRNVEPLGSQENAGAGPLKGLHVQVLVHVSVSTLLRRRAAAVAEHHGGARWPLLARQVVRDEGVGRRSSEWPAVATDHRDEG